MDSLAKRYLGYDTIKYEQVAGKGAKQILFSQVALDDATRYAAEDADVTLRLHRALSPKLAAEPGLETVYREIEMPLVPVLERIEANGVMIDADELRRQIGRPVASACWPRSRKPPNWPGAPSTSIRPSSWARCCSRNSSCR